MKLVSIYAFGFDKPGIIFRISELLARNNINIVDIEHSVLRNMFNLFIVADLKKSTTNINELKKNLSLLAKELGINIHISEFKRREEPKKNLFIVTVIGKDRIGIVRDITKIFQDYGINIESTSLTARDQLISIEFVIDIKDADPDEIKRILKDNIEKTGLDIVIYPYTSPERKRKRLVVFDMDSTLVDAEIIDEIAKAAGVEKEVKEITKKAMEGKISFKKALRERVKLLKGLPVEMLEKIYENIKLTEGAKELIRSLKSAGYIVAVVSGGFTYFTERLKKELGLDYAFGNKLEIKNGKLTGRLKGRIIDAKEKAKIIERIAKKEGINREDIIAIGDGANDKIMIERAGLGIAFNAKDVLKEIADGCISKENLIGIASILKLPSEFKKRV